MGWGSPAEACTCAVDTIPSYHPISRLLKLPSHNNDNYNFQNNHKRKTCAVVVFTPNKSTLPTNFKLPLLSQYQLTQLYSNCFLYISTLQLLCYTAYCKKTFMQLKWTTCGDTSSHELRRSREMMHTQCLPRCCAASKIGALAASYDFYGT